MNTGEQEAQIHRAEKDRSGYLREQEGKHITLPLIPAVEDLLKSERERQKLHTMPSTQ